MTGAALIRSNMLCARVPDHYVRQSPQCVTFDMGRVDTEAFDPECLGGSKRAFVVIQVRRSTTRPNET